MCYYNFIFGAQSFPFEPHHRTQSVDAALSHTWCGLSLLGARVNYAKTAELIEMPFGGQTRVDAGNFVLTVSPDSSQERRLHFIF